MNCARELWSEPFGHNMCAVSQKLLLLLPFLHTVQSICVCIGVVWFLFLYPAFAAAYVSLMFCVLLLLFSILPLFPIHHCYNYKCSLFAHSPIWHCDRDGTVFWLVVGISFTLIIYMRWDVTVIFLSHVLDQHWKYQPKTATAAKEIWNRKVKPVKCKRETAMHTLALTRSPNASTLNWQVHWYLCYPKCNYVVTIFCPARFRFLSLSTAVYAAAAAAAAVVAIRNSHRR